MSMADHIQMLLPVVERLHENLKHVSNRVTTCELLLDQHVADCQRQFEQCRVDYAGSEMSRLDRSAELRRQTAEMLHQYANVTVGLPLHVEDVMQAARVVTPAVGDSLMSHTALDDCTTEASVEKQAASEESESKGEDTVCMAHQRFLTPSSAQRAFHDAQSETPLESNTLGALVKENTLSSTSVEGLRNDHTEAPDDSKKDASEDPCPEQATDPEVITPRARASSMHGLQSHRINHRISTVSTPSWIGSGFPDDFMDVVKMTSVTPNTQRCSNTRRASVNGILSELRAIVRGDIFGTHPAVKEIFEKANTTRLKESVWDVSLFLLYSPLGRGTNCSVLLPVILTTFLQLSFASVVVLFIVNSEAGPLSLQSDFSAWFNNSEASEVMAVCSGDASLKSSFLQANAYDTYLTYSDTILGGSHGLHSAGPFTCVLVCSAWILIVLQELGEVLDKLLGVWNRTDRRCRVMELQVFQTPTSSGFNVLSIPPHRTAWFMFINFVECCIAILLLVAGLRWLVSTTEIVELLLNGVALSYVMEIDERIYSVFIPRKLSTLMSLLEPLPANWPVRIEIRNVILAVGAFVAIGVTLTLIDGHLKEVIITRDTLCPSHFIVDESTGVVP